MLTGLGPLDIAEVVAPEKAKPKRDGRICVCGHGAKNHGATESRYVKEPLDEVPQGSIACSVGRHQCACTKFFPVLVSEDNRRFMSKTVGPGAEHALARGVMNALNAGVGIRWREGLACGKCGTEGVALQPVAIMMRNGAPIIARRTAEYNYLLCANCVEELPIEADPSTLSDVNLPSNKF